MKPHVPGRYVRSQLEAERIAAKAPHVIAGMRGGQSNDVVQHDVFRLAALVTIESIRRGRVISWNYAVQRAEAQIKSPVQKFVKLRPTQDVAEAIVSTVEHELPEEEGRRELADQWSRMASDLDEGDDLEIVMTDGRTTRQLRYWGMQNLAMRTKLERGECVDLSGCFQVDGGEYDGAYVINADVWQEDVDYCNAITEEWIWSIGRALYDSGPAAQFYKHGDILASHTNCFYQNPKFECLFLR